MHFFPQRNPLISPSTINRQIRLDFHTLQETAFVALPFFVVLPFSRLDSQNFSKFQERYNTASQGSIILALQRLVPPLTVLVTIPADNLFKKLFVPDGPAFFPTLDLSDAQQVNLAPSPSDECGTLQPRVVVWRAFAELLSAGSRYWERKADSSEGKRVRITWIGQRFTMHPSNNLPIEEFLTDTDSC